MNNATARRIVALSALTSFLALATGALVADVAEPAESKRVVDEQQRLEQWEGYAEAKAEGRIVYVAGDGSGDFNSDGTDDHVEINQAIEQVVASEQFTTVHLKGPNVYVINDTLRLDSDLILQGDATAVLKLQEHSKWPKYKAMIASRYMEPGVYTRQNPQPIRNITIRGFEMDGNRANNADVDEETGRARKTGAGYDYLIQLVNAYDVTINDMYLHSMLTDGVVFMNSGEHAGADINSRFFNNRIQHCGHDGFYMINLNRFEIHDNFLYDNRTNSAIRLGRCDHVSIYNNVLRNDPTRVFSGNAGVQAHYGASPVTNVRIYGNIISRMGLGGLVIYGRGGEFGTQTGVHIHNNIIHDCASAGIRVFGLHNTLIENNVIYGNHGDGILYYFVYHPDPAYKPGPPPEGEKYITIVRNNIIAGSLGGAARAQTMRNAPVSGFALNNCIGVPHPADNRPELVLEDIHQFISEHNCIWDNASGPYNNASSDSDIYEDPLFAGAERGRFRIRPGSPCIGAGTDAGNIGAY